MARGNGGLCFELITVLAQCLFSLSHWLKQNSFSNKFSFSVISDSLYKFFYSIKFKGDGVFTVAFLVVLKER